MDAAWHHEIDGTEKEKIRQAMLDMFGHAPDPVQTWAELENKMEVVEFRKNSSMLHLSCGLCGDVALLESSAGMDDVCRNRILRQVLLGRAKRGEVKSLRNAITFQSRTLEVRTRLTVKLACKWLRGRRDLLPFIETLVGVAGMGAGSFCSYVAAVCCLGSNDLIKLIEKKGIFKCCIKCALSASKQFKIAVRFGTTDVPERDGEIFDWQYLTHMLGRFDHEVFSDKDDLTTRVDYDKNQRISNAMDGYRDKFDAKYEELLEAEGDRFGYICGKNRNASGRRLLPLTALALTAVPTGSVPAIGVNGYAKDEIPIALLNKKLAIIYMTEGEEMALKMANANTRSGWMWKLEIGKLRNLVPGTYSYYLSSARVSAYGESAFLGELSGVPLMWGEAHKEADNRKFMEYQELGYVANRDFKNYNICHKHERMQMFYLAGARRCDIMGETELADEFRYMARCLDDVGVYVDGVYNKWEFGLQSGWAHTMLFHCVHNSCAGRAAEAIVNEMCGWRRMIGRHQGDDSAEVWSNVMAAPIAQAMLDSSGQVGQSDKQHFARKQGSWSEFLRIWTRSGMIRGSALRVIGGFVSGDSQHPVLEGGHEAVRTIVTIMNTIWRRLGGTIYVRRSDIEGMIAYWSQSNESYRNGDRHDWRAHMCGKFGLSLAAFPEMRWNLVKGQVVKKMRYQVKVGRMMLKRSARNLELAGRVEGLGEYAQEYAEDMLACSVQHSFTLEEVKLSGAEEMPENSRYEDWLAKKVVDHCHSGQGGWRDEDDFCKQVAIGYLFAGSERVAKASVATGRSYAVRGSDGMREKVFRGLDLLSDKIRGDKPIVKESLVCAEKYWAHAELLIRDFKNTPIIQRVLGYAIARIAIASGELM